MVIKCQFARVERLLHADFVRQQVSRRIENATVKSLILSRLQGEKIWSYLQVGLNSAMSNQGEEDSPPSSEAGDNENTENQKHRITRVNKIFQNTVNDKLEMAICKRSKLISLLKKFEESKSHISEKHTKELVEVTDEYELLTNDL